jgi:hypothetical protein
MVNPVIGRFVLGSILGFIWEKMVAPDLPGAIPAPVRPIYGVGAVLATRDLKTNCQKALAAELVAHKMNPSLWNYDTEHPLTVNQAVRADYNLAFGSAMTLANALFEKMGL